MSPGSRSRQARPVWDTRGTRVGIFIAQAINHANHHREQVCAVLTGLGIEPPGIQAWEYAWTSERIWDL